MLEFLMDKLPPGCEDYCIETFPVPNGFGHLEGRVSCQKCDTSFDAAGYFVESLVEEILVYISRHNRQCPGRLV